MEGVFELEGVVLKKGEVQEVGDSGYKKQYVVIECLKREYNGKTYSEKVNFLADRGRIDTLVMINEGDAVKFGFSLSGRSYKKPEWDEEKYFNDVKLIWINLQNAAPRPVHETSAVVVNRGYDDVDEAELPF